MKVNHYNMQGPQGFSSGALIRYNWSNLLVLETTVDSLYRCKWITRLKTELEMFSSHTEAILASACYHLQTATIRRFVSIDIVLPCHVLLDFSNCPLFGFTKRLLDPSKSIHDAATRANLTLFTGIKYSFDMLEQYKTQMPLRALGGSQLVSQVKQCWI